MASTRQFRLRRTVALLALLTLGAAACGGDDGSAAPEDGSDTDAAAGEDSSETAIAGGECEGGPIQIGLMSPMSGQYANWGEGWTNAAKLAFEEWNAQGGVLGCELVGLYEDDQADPTEGANVANRLVAEEVSGVVGPIFSGVTLAAGSIFDDAQIPFLIGSSAIAITAEQGWDSVFRIAPREDEFGPLDAQIALDAGYTRGAVIHDNSAFAQGLAVEFVTAFEAEGGEVVEEVITPGESDYSAVLTNLASMPDLEFIYYSGYFAEGAQLVRQGKDLGLTEVAWLFGNSNQDNEFIEIAGDAAEGILMGTWVPPTAENNELAQAYVETYNEAYGEDPSSLYHWAYDGVNILATAMQETGSRDAAELTQALHEMSFEGTSGPIAFDEAGDRAEQPLGVLTVTDGAFAPVQ